MGTVKLNRIDPSSHSGVRDKSQALKLTAQLDKELYELLYLMFAFDHQSLLIILQGIDCSGKDGAVRHIFSASNPQGMRVFSFKRPSLEELRHDFLWRCHRHTPESGLAVIFNRSYYEEVTTTMVHPKLLKQQHIPPINLNEKEFFRSRYEQINDFEKMLSAKGTLVIKFFLHVSKQEQKRRLTERLKDRSKNWKFSPEDLKERKHWDAYMHSFEQMINATSTTAAKWTVVPSDNKWYRDYLVSKTLVSGLRKLKMQFPKAMKT